MTVENTSMLLFSYTHELKKDNKMVRVNQKSLPFGNDKTREETENFSTSQ